MIKLKELLNESVVGNISPTDIFNFYFLFYYNSHEPQLLNTPYGQEIERECLNSIKSKYIITFKELIAEQINKYIRSGRIDADFPVKSVSAKDSAEMLSVYMAKTFRSDKVRRNDVWNIAAKATADLERISNPKMLYFSINALNMAVHNTQSAILGKLQPGSMLLSALDACANVDPKYFVGRVSKDLRGLLKNSEVNERLLMEMIGKHFLISADNHNYLGLFSKNIKPNEEPWRMTVFTPSESPLGHVQLNNDEANGILSNFIPTSVLDKLKRYIQTNDVTISPK